MANVKVEEQSLINIANELRKVLGETRIEQQSGMVPVKKISKTSNAINFEEFKGEYPSASQNYDTITIPGASNLHVKMAYQTEGTSYDWVQVWSGSQHSPSGNKYGDRTLEITELDFSGTDTITFYFRSDNSGGNYLGYYAEITGTDASGHPVEGMGTFDVEVLNSFKPSEMSSAIPLVVEKANPIPKKIMYQRTTGSYGSATLPCPQNKIVFLVVDSRMDGWAFYLPAFRDEIIASNKNIWSIVENPESNQSRLHSQTTNGIDKVYVVFEK